MDRDFKREDDGGCKILQFRLRDKDGDHQRAVDNPKPDIDRLLSLSRYENPPRPARDGGPTKGYNARMIENAIAAVFLSGLVAVSAFDFIGLERTLRCTSVIACGP